MKREFRPFLELNEETKRDLLRTSKDTPNYKSRPEINRWIAKNNCQMKSPKEDYNNIDMDTFWKSDILKLKFHVQGETSNHIVECFLINILDALSKKVIKNENELTEKLIYEVFLESLNDEAIRVFCNCDDFKYRFQYWASKKKYNAGPEQKTKTEVTNPNDNLGASCKHVLYMLNTSDWPQKIAKVIFNYIDYSKTNFKDLYKKYIFPKIYGQAYSQVDKIFKDMDDSKNKVTDIKLLNLKSALVGKK